MKIVEKWRSRDALVDPQLAAARGTLEERSRLALQKLGVSI